MNNYLSLILFTPLIGALVMLFVSKQNENAIRWIANITAFIGFLISVPLWFWYNPQGPEFQFQERLPWIPSIGAEYFIGIDGLSTLLILLTTMMGFIAILSSWNAITERVKEYYIFLLVLQTGMLGAFMALDFMLFFLFWEVMLVPMYFLIGIWGSANRLYSAIKFFLYTLVGSVIMLLGILALYFAYHNDPANLGAYTFDITRYRHYAFAANLQWWVFLAFFCGFAVKVPMFPLHTWLPDAHTDAPTAGSVILAAVMLKMGTYGFLRFSLPILPEGTRAFVPMMVLLSIIGIVYGALVALAQKDWKRLVAYSSVSHMAMVMLGMFALNPVGLTGSIVQQLDWRALPPRRRRLRAAAHSRNLRVRRPVEGDAGVRGDLPGDDDVVNRPADAERIHRRNTDSARRVRREQGLGGLRRERRGARRGLHAVSVSAHHVRQDREPEERAPARPEPA
jgi:NADH-quinone oxidoreductase subunit M